MGGIMMNVRMAMREQTTLIFPVIAGLGVQPPQIIA